MPDMVFALSIIGIAFAAVCAWLTVRIVNRRERSAKRTLAAVVGIPVLYVASFGPTCWMSDWFGLSPGHGVRSIYGPLLAYRVQSSATSNALTWYGESLSPSYLSKRGTAADRFIFRARDRWGPRPQHKTKSRRH